MLKRYDTSTTVKPIIGGDGKTSINVFGRIKDENFDDIPTFVDDKGNTCVRVTFLGKLSDYRLVDLMACHFKFMDNWPYERLQRVTGFIINPVEEERYHAKNVGYRFIGGKLEVEEHPGYYYVPGYPNRAINEDGMIISTNSGVVTTWFVTKPQDKGNIKGGYWVTTIYMNGKNAQLSRHRALSLVFKDYPDNADFMIINHINGNPGDDRLDNLEWANHKVNLDHAYQNGLRSQNKPVLARNVLTGEVRQFYSVAECGRKLGILDKTLNFRLEKCAFSSVNRDGYQLKYADDNRSWIIPDDPKEAIARAVQALEVTYKDCKTGEVKSASSVSQAGKETGINPDSISYRLNRDDLSVLFGYQFKYIDDVREFPEVSKDEILKSLDDPLVKVDARNLLTGEKISFDSKKEASDFNEKVVMFYKDDDQPIYPSGWQFKKADKEWIDVDNPIEAVYQSNNQITATNVVCGEKLIASSSRHMAKLIGGCSKRIRKAALTRGKRAYRGYVFTLG